MTNDRINLIVSSITMVIRGSPLYQAYRNNSITIGELKEGILCEIERTLAGKKGRQALQRQIVALSN